MRACFEVGEEFVVTLEKHNQILGRKKARVRD
jgi:hypothetical protein